MILRYEILTFSRFVFFCIFNQFNFLRKVNQDNEPNGAFRQNGSGFQQQQQQLFSKSCRGNQLDKKSQASSWTVKKERFNTSAPASPSNATTAKHQHPLPVRSQNLNWEATLTAHLSDDNNRRRLTVTQRHCDNNNNNNNNNNSSSSPSSARWATAHLPPMHCSFCENNGEEKRVYMSHPLKDSLGKVVCPILRVYVCPKCGESGDHAHTNKYCPETQRKLKENKIRKCFENNNN
jgi:hypothetical protein